MPDTQTDYDKIIEHVFFNHYEPGMRQFSFDRTELVAAAAECGVQVPRNLGDVLYSFRHRRALPQRILDTAQGEYWVIENDGRRAGYRFVIRDILEVIPNPLAAIIRIPDATPGIIKMHAKGDEQALLARLRYNRLLDVFTGIACYSLQSHLRTTVSGAQIETDEVYVGISQSGAQYVLPVQAKGGTDRMGIVQIEQDFALCAQRFPDLIARPIGAQFMGEEVIALFGFGLDGERVTVLEEKHYKLVPSEDFTSADLDAYRRISQI